MVWLWFGFGLAVVCLYLLSVFIRAELAEQKAEKRIIEILTEVASPWDASLMRKNGSEWLLNRAPLSPEKIAELASNDLGSLREIVKKPAKQGTDHGFYIFCQNRGLSPDSMHQVPKGLQVDEVVNMGQHAMSMHVVSTAS